MKNRNHERDEAQCELFKVELSRIVDRGHEMVRLADRIDWKHFENCFDSMWDDHLGRPAIDTRLMVSLHYLKYAYDLSDDQVIETWLQNPYWQYLSGMRYFQHERPIDPLAWPGKTGRA